MPTGWGGRIGLGALLCAAALLAGCAGGDHCLAGDEACERTRPCAALHFVCDEPGELYAGRVSGHPGGIGLREAEGTGNDFLLRNARVSMVVADLDEPQDLAPTGGFVLDFGPIGGRDAVVSIYQLSGILPGDAFAYRDIEVIDRRPELVAVVARGTLDGRPDVEVATRYELRPCEPGVRVRSELHNRSADVQVFILADAAHWGKRDALPFAPEVGQGFSQPPLDLLELQASYRSFPFVAARPAAVDATTYGFVGCDRRLIEGVNDAELSALGTGVELVRPGELLVYERFLVAAGGRDLDEGIAAVTDARRMLHGGPPPRDLRARVTAGGLGFGGDVRRAVVVLSEVLAGGETRPLTAAVPGADGALRARVPSEANLAWEAWSFGRVVARGEVPAGSGRADVGEIALELPARLVVSAADPGGEPLFATLALHPADDETRARVTGSWFGRFGECAPWLGPPVGASPACNLVLVPPEGADAEVPAGRYEAYLTAGPDRALARHFLDLEAGEVAALEATLAPIPGVSPDGWLAADLHVHGRASFDSSIPDLDRVRSFAAAGIDVVAATDHDYVTAYEDAVVAAGLDDRVRVIGGIETTQLIPFMEVPGDDFPRVIGHYNFWPIEPRPDAPRGGAPWDELLEPGELFDVMAPLVGEDGVMQMNHPWDDPQFGRDLGYLRAINFDPRSAIPPEDDGTRNGMLRRRPGLRSNLDFDTIELMNGAHLVEVLRVRPLWFSLLCQGFAFTATASSDSHSLSDNQLGYARTLVEAGVGIADFEVAAFNRSLREGRAIGGNGVVVLATVGVPGGERRGLGFAPHVPAPGDTLEIEVRAPPWIPVTEVRVVSSRGARIVTGDGELFTPPDPLGTEGALRFTASLPLADLVAAGDDWIVVEAGLPLPLHADLEGDGVPDTGDNNGDGRVDQDDIEKGEDSGPLLAPPDPRDPADPRHLATRVVPELWPYGFTNPILIDGGGDGWIGPGIDRCELLY